MSPEEVKLYIEKNKEDDYLLVDVRQPEEYVRGHIPGAKLIPIKELVTDLFKLPSGKDLIFYCHSGGRSAAAAVAAASHTVAAVATRAAPAPSMVSAPAQRESGRNTRQLNT